MKKIQGVQFSEIMETEYPERTAAVSGLLVHGFTLLVAKEGMGKSFLVQNIALGVASGGNVLGSIPVEKKEVLYLALEDNYERIQGRGLKMLNGGKAPNGITVALEMESLDGEDSNGVRQIREFISDHPDTGLIIIDTLAKCAVPRRNTDARAEAYRLLGPLQQIGLKEKVSFIGVHHMKKGKEEDLHDQSYGSAGYLQVADTVMMLDRVRNANSAKLDVSGRDLGHTVYDLKWSPDLLTWGIVGTSNSLEPITRPELASERVLLFLNNLPECLDIRATDLYTAMAQKYDMPIGTTKDALIALKRQERIDMEHYQKTGRYRVLQIADCIVEAA